MAWIYEDKDGVCAQHCPTKEIAQKMMQEIVDEEINIDKDDEDADFDPPIVIALEDIEEARIYGHRKCDGVSIGEAICWGCGEPCSWIGRKVFVCNFYA